MWTQWPALITWLTLILLALLAADVARARGRHGVRAPATTGNEQFERVVHNPARRGGGFTLAMLGFGVLLVGSALGWMQSLGWM